MTNILLDNPEFEQNRHIETERKFLVIFPEQLKDERENATPIEQLYLSHPSENFSLRLREYTIPDGTVSYTATLKDRGVLTPDGLQRMEVETPIDAATYDFYKHDNVASIKKLRTHLSSHVMIDFFEDGTALLESEDHIALTSVLNHRNIPLAEITGDRMGDNEWRAYHAYRKTHGGAEILTPETQLGTDRIVHELMEAAYTKTLTVAAITGRSGSGKSTIVSEIKLRLNQSGIACEVISTDDYHRGKTWLETHNGGEPWTDWDARIVYDIDALKRDISILESGGEVMRRRMDFEIEEPVFAGMLQQPRVLILEGIYAASRELSDMVRCRYHLPTPLATCIGRRLLRDLKERPQFADPAKSLRYMLEYAEPAFRQLSGESPS